MATVTVRMATAGGRRILQALRGLRRANTQANRSAQQESTRTKRTVEKNIRATEATERRGAGSTERSEKKKRRSVRRTEQERERSFRNEVRRQRRLIRRQQRIDRARAQAERGMQGRHSGLLRGVGRGALIAGGAALGAGRAGLGVVRGLQGTLGIRSQQEIIGQAVDTRQNFIRAAVQGGLRGPQIQSAIERSAAIAGRTGVAPEQILGGIGVAQERFSSLLTAQQGGQQGIDDFFRNIEFMAEVSRTTGASMEDVVGAAGEFQRQFGLNADETRDALSLVAEGALQGSLSLRDFADRFPAAIASFQGARGTTGIESLREFQAIAQAMRAGGLDPRRARTFQENLLGSLSNRGAQRRLRRLGLNVRDPETGNLRNLGDIISEGAGNERLQNVGRLQEALGSREAASAFLILTQQENRARAGQGGAITLQERIDVDIESGAELFRETMQELNQDVSGEVIRQRIQREAQLVAQSDELIERFANLTRVLTDLEDIDPFFSTVTAPIATGAAQGLGIAALLSRLGGGGAAAAAGGAATGGGGLMAAGAGAGGLAGLAGTGVGAASLGAIAAAVAAGLVVAGAVTAVISETGAFATGDEAAGGRSLLTQIGDLPNDIAIAFSGGIIESLENAFGAGPASSDAAVAEQRRRTTRKEIVGLDPETIRQLKPIPFEPGAGRRGEGAATE